MCLASWATVVRLPLYNGSKEIIYKVWTGNASGREETLHSDALTQQASNLEDRAASLQSSELGE